MVKKCAVCGEDVASDAIVCPKCGRGVFEPEKRHNDPADAARPALSIGESDTGEKRQSSSFWRTLFGRKKLPRDQPSDIRSSNDEANLDSSMSDELKRYEKLVKDHLTRLEARLPKDRTDRTTTWTRAVIQRVIDQEVSQICLLAHAKMAASLADGERHSASVLMDDLFVSISTFPCSVDEARRKYYTEGYLPYLDRMVSMGRQENPHCHWLHFQFFCDGNLFWFHFTLFPNKAELGFPPRYELPIELLSNEEKTNLGLK
jgi:hypothetical protein